MIKLFHSTDEYGYKAYKITVSENKSIDRSDGFARLDLMATNANQYRESERPSGTYLFACLLNLG